MPLHLGKIAALIAFITIAAFIIWLLIGSLWRGAHADSGQARSAVASVQAFAVPT